MSKNPLVRAWRSYRYKHTTGAIVGLVLFITLLDSAIMIATFDFIETLGYIGGFIAGILSASYFTAVAALAMIIDIAPLYDALPLAILVGLGNAVGDMLLLMFFQERVYGELKPLFRKMRFTTRISGRFRRTKYTLSLLLGILFLVTPLPDEIGLATLGIAHFPRPVILMICWGLNTLGAAVVIFAAQTIAG